MNSEQQSQIKSLIAKGKEQGYLTYREVNDHLPDEIVDSEQIEDIINMINDMGIPVHEVAPDADSMLMSDSAVQDDDAAEEAAAALASVDSDFGRTTDPVRMYMREMGTVELLTREGEILLAKRIEDGVRQVIEALSTNPATIDELLRLAARVQEDELRLSDLITGFVDPNEDDAPIAPPVVATSTDDNDSDDDSDDDAAVDTGPDPEEARQRFEHIGELHAKYTKAAEKKGAGDKSVLKLQQACTDAFMELKLSQRFIDRMVERQRAIVDRIRAEERMIMNACVKQAKMPRKDFIQSFPQNETNPNWLESVVDESKPYSSALNACKEDVRKAQIKLSEIEGECRMTIHRLKEINRNMSIE
ncbi:MAG: RNA polymerase sigma factor RpoD, partial [Gammaproteobacteria bacterium]|nr:RNA polymerase sigma factor RpoD [Gammaproteobacteria bacterium]